MPMSRYTVHGVAECGAQVRAEGDTLRLAFQALDEACHEADRVAALLADPSEYVFEPTHRLAADLEPNAPARVRPGIPVPAMPLGVLTHPEYV